MILLRSLLLLLCVGGVLAEVAVALRADVTVAGPTALIGDIAALSGDDGLVEQIASIPVQELAGLGDYRIEAANVRALIRRRLSAVSATVTGTTVVRRGRETLTTADLIAVAEKKLHEQAVDLDLTATVRREPTPAVVAVAAQPLEVEAKPLTHAVTGQVPFRMTVRRDGRELHRTIVVFEIRAFAQLPVASRAIPRNHTIGLQDLVLRRVELPRGRARPTATIESLLGRVTTVPVTAGAPIKPSLTRRANLIVAGAQVPIIFVGERFTVSGIGQAISSGAEDDVVRIRQPSGRVVQGRVQADGSAVINFR